MITYSDSELNHIAYLAQYESRNKLHKYLLSKLEDVNKQLIANVCTQIEKHPKQAIFNYCHKFIKPSERSEAYQEWLLAALEQAKAGSTLQECIDKGNRAMSQWATSECNAKQHIQYNEEI